MSTSDVVLINMPYSAIEHPSISPGYFSAALKKRGVRVYALSANMYSDPEPTHRRMQFDVPAELRLPRAAPPGTDARS